jgi:hypothetical protein
VNEGQNQRASDLHFQGSRVGMSLASARRASGREAMGYQRKGCVDKAYEEFIQRSVRR